MTIENSNQFKKDLEQFYGTINYYKLGYYPVYATDGVEYFCRTAEAYWLFDEIAHFICHKTKEPFVVAIITVNNTDNGRCAVLKYEDGNCNEIGGKVIDYTDLPVGEWKLWASNHPEEKVVMLPSEY